MASVTFIQKGGTRGVTGQTVEAFWNSISHVPLLSVGMNCALGPEEMRPLIEELSQIAPIYVSVYPNAGLPNPLLPTGFPETPESLAPQLAEWARAGMINIDGGCCGTAREHIAAVAAAVRGLGARAGMCASAGGWCGTTPEHIAKIAEAVRGIAPRVVRPAKSDLSLSGNDA